MGRYEDTDELGTENYFYTTYVGEGQYGPVAVNDGVAEYVSLEVKREEIGLLLREDECIVTEYEVVTDIQAPVEKGQIAGYERYVLDGEVLAEFPFVTVEKVDKITLWYCLGKIVEKIFI